MIHQQQFDSKKKTGQKRNQFFLLLSTENQHSLEFT